MGNYLSSSQTQATIKAETDNKIIDKDNESDKITAKINSDSVDSYDEKKNHILIAGYVRQIAPVLYTIVPVSIIHLLHQHYDSWMQLKPAPTMTLIHPYPVCYYSSMTQREYIIISPHIQNSNKIIQYDTKQNSWSVLTEYPENFDCECHGIVLDPTQEILYFCFGYGQVFGWFDLKIKEWTVKCSASAYGDPDNFGIIRVGHPKACFVSDLNEIHVIVHIRHTNDDINYHMKFSAISKKFEMLNKKFNIPVTEIIYIQQKKLLLAVGGLWGCYNPRPVKLIYYCDCSGNILYDWKQFPCCLPYKSEIKCEIIFGTLLIGYFEEEKEVWCLDVDDIDGKLEWMKCVTVKLNVYHIVITKNEFIHFIGTFDGEHCKVHLSQVLPLAVYDKYYSNVAQSNVAQYAFYC